MAEAKAIAEKAAMKDISSKLPENVDLVSRKVHVSSFDEQEINAVVYVETVENIGHFVSLD